MRKPSDKKLPSWQARGRSYWLVMRHARGTTAQEAKLGPMSHRALLLAQKIHRNEEHSAMRCYTGVQRSA